MLYDARRKRGSDALDCPRTQVALHRKHIFRVFDLTVFYLELLPVYRVRRVSALKMYILALIDKCEGSHAGNLLFFLVRDSKHCITVLHVAEYYFFDVALHNFIHTYLHSINQKGITRPSKNHLLFIPV